MKNNVINARNCATRKNIFTYGTILTLVFAWNICLALNVNAQQRDGRSGYANGHFSNVTARGGFISRPPLASSRVYYGGRDFYYHEGVYYHPYRNGYVVAPPPFGLSIDLLPNGYSSFYVGGLPYYYYGGTYYMQRGRHFVVVAPPRRDLVRRYPQGYRRV